MYVCVHMKGIKIKPNRIKVFKITEINVYKFYLVKVIFSNKIYTGVV